MADRPDQVIGGSQLPSEHAGDVDESRQLEAQGATLPLSAVEFMEYLRRLNELTTQALRAIERFEK